MLVLWCLASADIPIETSQLCDVLARQHAALESVTLRFTIESHYGKGSPMPPDASLLGPDTLTSRHVIETLRTGDCYRVDDDFTFRTVDDGLEEFWDGRTITTWDGVECRSFRCNLKKPSAGVLDIRIDPGPDVFAEYFMTWQGWWLLHGPERISFVDLLGRDDVRGPDLLSDGRTRWKIGPWPISKAQEIVILARRAPNGIELDEAHFRVYADNEALTGTDADLRATSIFEFGPLDGNASTRLPGSCTVKLGHWRGRGAEHDFWGFARIELMAVDPAVADDWPFRMAPRPHSSIIDQRYRIAYDQGAQTINIDGRILQTHQPVHGDVVGHELEWWVQRGQWLDSIEPVTERAPSPADDDSSDTDQD